MRLPRPGRRRIGRAARISSVFSTVTTVVVPFVMDVTANQLTTLGRWVPWAVMAGGAAISITLMALVMIALLFYVRNASRSGGAHG